MLYSYIGEGIDGDGLAFDQYEGGFYINRNGQLQGTTYSGAYGWSPQGSGSDGYAVASDGFSLLGAPPGVTILAPTPGGLFWNGWAYVSKMYFSSPCYFQVGASPWYWYGDTNSDIVIDGHNGWPASNFVTAPPQTLYLKDRVYNLATVTQSGSSSEFSDAVCYVNPVNGDMAGLNRYYTDGSWTAGSTWIYVDGHYYTGGWDPLTQQATGVPISFSIPSGNPQSGPAAISSPDVVFQFYNTGAGGDVYWSSSGGTILVGGDGSVAVTDSSGNPIQGTYDATSHLFDFGPWWFPLVALDTAGNPVGLPSGLTFILGAAGFGDSVLLTDGVHQPDYTYRRPDGSWGKKYVGLPENYWFLVADNEGNYNSQLYISQNGEMVVNAIGGWPVANSYPAQVYVNGVICPLHWDTNYVGGTGQSTYGGASYISADNSKTVTLSWAWDAGPTWMWSMGSQSGAWNHADTFSSLPNGVSIHLAPPPSAPTYGPPRLKLNGTELVFQGLASQDAGADVYIGGGRRLTIQPDGSVTVTDVSTGGVLLSGYYNASTHVVGFLGANVGTVIITMDASGNVLGVSQNATIASGYRHNIAVRTDGTIWAWGTNQFGQLGNGTNVSSDVPVQVNGLTGATAVAAGLGHTLALKNDGTVWAWGLNANGQLGNNSTTASNVPVQVNGLTGVVAIAAGFKHSLAVKADGTIWAWGGNGSGQLGTSSTIDSHVPIQVSGISNGISVAAAYDHSLAIKSDGTTWSWGNNVYGQLGDASNTSSSTPVQVAGMNDSWVSSVGGQFSLDLKSDGTIWAWGLGSIGQLGNNATTGSNVPVAVTDLNEVVAIAAGGSHSLAIRGDGSLWSWGHNDLGQLGNYTGNNSLVPGQVYGVDDPVAIAGGQSHSLAIASNGNIFGWGDGFFGQLGNSTVDLSENPVQLVGLNSVAAISAGAQYSLAVTSDGAVWAWGTGNLGGGYTTRLMPNPISGEWSDSVVAVAGGYWHSLALSRDGHVWAWGANSDGELGNNSTASSLVPVQVAAIANVTQIAAGEVHSVCAKSDGTVWAWGYNAEGELGNNSTTASSVPVQVNALTGITAISAQTAGHHTLALKDDGTVWAWGANWNGQLGNNTSDDSPVPVQVTGLANVVSIAAGYAHSLALKSDGTVWAWGNNGEGELGNSGADGLVPMQVPGLAGVVKIGAGSYHSAIVKSDGSLWTWGANWSGQLGNGTTTDSPVPLQVNGVFGVKALACGDVHTLALKEDGTLESWGDSVYGELGVGWGGTQAKPTVVLGLNLLHPAPQIAFTTPQPNTSDTVSMDQGVNLQFSATSGDSALREIQLWSEGVYLGSTYSGNSYWWQPPTWGDFVLTSVAVDQNGATSARSAPVAIHVPFDSDGDGIPDWWEMQHGLNPHDASDAGQLSSDGLLTNLQKYRQGLNPATADSDGDGVPDSVEIANGTNLLRKDATVVGLRVTGFTAP